MQKVLRSLIHEVVPLDLRVETALLTRRRDLINAEKHEAMLNLLRDFGVKNVKQLGPGTNRYSIKLNGFVTKLSTDHDGIIDNFTEFKMSQRIGWSNASSTYEVSQNGNFLVSEYVRPFQSYAEMLKYKDKICEKLKKLSAFYLIGDVGISPKNYSNWGIRLGTNDPVMLDYAYTFEVKSEIFLCQQCKTNTMIVPTDDFTGLYCPVCHKQYSFEDIRGLIGNDEHRHNISDIADEGYLLTDSHVLTTLDENRSPYLRRKEQEVKKEEKPKKELYVPDHFELEHPPLYYIGRRLDHVNV